PIRPFVFPVLAGAALAACMTDDVPVAPEPVESAALPASTEDGAVAYTQLKGPDGTPHGRAVLTQTGTAVAVDIQVQDIPPGKHGIHIHETGLCDAPDFKSAGGHWNPTNEPHPRHKGGFGNIVVAADGTATMQATMSDATLSGAGNNLLLDADGAALIVHADADDLQSQPSGNAGARIACGVISGE
ncbi:MAG: superoxide dismutase family protein, partial [Pseudomonadota bacterium]